MVGHLNNSNSIGIVTGWNRMGGDLASIFQNEHQFAKQSKSNGCFISSLILYYMYYELDALP